MLTEHEKRCREWGLRRNIRAASSPQAQLCGVVEEVGEFMDYYGAGDVEGMADSIGDARVYMANALGFYSGLDFEECSRRSSLITTPLCSGITSMVGLVLKYSSVSLRAAMSSDADGLGLSCGLINRGLGMLARYTGKSLSYCDDLAWESIKHRRGLFYNQKFVKEADLTSQQKEQLAELQNLELPE